MKQSAVEFLTNHILNSDFNSDKEWKEVFKTAKEMEKEQICNAFESGEVCILFKNEGNAINYYNQTYTNEKI